VRNLKKFEKLNESLEVDVKYYLQHIKDDGFEFECSDDFFRIYKPISGNTYRYDNLKSFSYKEISDDVQRLIDVIENSYNIRYVYIIISSPLGTNKRIIVDKHNLYELDKINSMVIGLDKF
jgi:hypothetical protein